MLQDHDEGYIKFNCNWKPCAPFPQPDLAALNSWRQKLYEIDLLGAYPDGVGFGNVSQRVEGNHFYISGSKSGNIEKLEAKHYAKVIHFKVEENRVTCEGPIIASSESMSHAVIYQELPWVNAVFHVHHLNLWQSVLNHIPTTGINAAYGTPEMANEITRLLRETNVTETKVFAMAGHREGLISFGESLQEAGEALLALKQKH